MSKNIQIKQKLSNGNYENLYPKTLAEQVVISENDPTTVKAKIESLTTSITNLDSSKAPVTHTHTTSQISGLGTAATKNVGTTSGTIPVLDSNGKIDASLLPAIAITDTYEVSSESAMLALSAQKGDVAIRSDINKSFILKQEPASTLSNWAELKTPTDAVLSVNGKTGAVNLTASDVGAAALSHTHADKANINSPAFTGTPTAPTPEPTDNSTRIATTAFINNVINSISKGLIQYLTYGTSLDDLTEPGIYMISPDGWGDEWLHTGKLVINIKIFNNESGISGVMQRVIEYGGEELITTDQYRLYNHESDDWGTWRDWIPDSIISKITAVTHNRPTVIISSSQPSSSAQSAGDLWFEIV